MVVTTVGDGRFLEHYARAILDGSCADSVRLVVVPDRRTPDALYTAAEQVSSMGVRVICLGLGEQESMTRLWGVPDLFPWNSDNRRNLGYAIGWRDGRDMVISIDDDNLPAGPGFFEQHVAALSRSGAAREVSSSTGWFNCCSLLDCDPPGIYPRGFPYRYRTSAELTFRTSSRLIVANAGLWIGDPDVDAMTRLVLRPTSRAFVGDEVVLAPDTWCPVNSQNTAIAREALPAYYFVKMGWPMDGSRVERFGDIMSGLFLQACAKHMGHAVSFGLPCAWHDRNEHDLLADARAELPAIAVMEDLAAWLVSLELEGSSYLETYSCLSDNLDAAAERFRSSAWTSDGRNFLRGVAACMREWTSLMKRLAG